MSDVPTTTLRETLAADEKVTSFSSATLRAVKTWLRRHSFSDCVPLEVGKIGTVYVREFEEGDWYPMIETDGDSEDEQIDGRRVVLLPEVK